MAVALVRVLLLSGITSVGYGGGTTTLQTPLSCLSSPSINVGFPPGFNAAPLGCEGSLMKF